MRTKTSIEIFRYWQDRKGNDDVPARSRIEPQHVRHILGDLFILEQDLFGDIRFRLAGTRVCALVSRELRGLTFDSLWASADMARASGAARRAMQKSAPTFLTGTGSVSPGESVPIEVTMLPLRSGDGAADRIIGSLTPLGRPPFLDIRPVNMIMLETVQRLDRTARPPSLPETPASLPETMEAPAIRRPRENPFSQAVRRVLHLSVLDGGRLD